MKLVLGRELGLSAGDFVLDGDPAPPPIGGGAHVPNFRPIPIVAKRLQYGCIKTPPGMNVGLSPGDFVFDGDPVPFPQEGGGAPKFSAHVYCGQTAGWINMPLGTKIGLSPGDSVMLDGDQPPTTGSSSQTLQR